MKISIRQPLCFTEQGRKAGQEDSLYPRMGRAGTADKYFLVCDGVGGSDHGEVASATVSTTIGEILGRQEFPDGILTEDIFNAALDQAYAALDGAHTQYPDSYKRMATTLTFLGIHRGGVLIAHIGDSRVYHVRPGAGILSQTSDHSLVNDLLKAGQLTPEQARNFKQKNVITRAMQPLMEVRDRAEFTPTLPVQAGDYFFLCCDGVLEHLTNELLTEILSDTGLSDEQKLAAIHKICADGDTRDNYTCYLVPIDRVEAEPEFDDALATEEAEAVVEPDAVEPAPAPAPAAEAHMRPQPPSAPAPRPDVPITATPAPAGGNPMKWIVILLCAALAACCAYIFFSRDKDKADDDTPVTTATGADAAPDSPDSRPTKIYTRESAAPGKPAQAEPAKPATGKPQIQIKIEQSKPGSVSSSTGTASGDDNTDKQKDKANAPDAPAAPGDPAASPDNGGNEGSKPVSRTRNGNRPGEVSI